MYKQSNNGCVIRISDGSLIPECPGNMDYEAYLAWLSEGHTPEPADPEPPNPSKDQRRRQILDSVGCFNQIHFDKDWALLESERERLGVTEAQAYADNVMYRGFADARSALAEIDAE